MNAVHKCFLPIVTPETRVLILGSLPGVASLGAGQYYAHPRNQFWRLLEAVVERPLSTIDYPARLDALRLAGVGLWDTVATASRTGSLDADIRLRTASDVATLAANLPSLGAIAFNGGTAARIGRRSLGATTTSLIDLPSSSPANTLPFASKAAAWAALRDYLD